MSYLIIGGEIVFYPKLFPDPHSIAPMFLGTPPFNHVKRFKGPPFLHNTQMVITNNIFFTLPFLLTVKNTLVQFEFDFYFSIH